MKRALLPLLVLAVSCGGSSGGGNPIAPAVLTTESHSGSVAPSTSGCNSSTHEFNARAGAMSVRLDATSSDGQDFGVQICTGGGATGTCALPQQRITIGQTLTATSGEGVAQRLTLLRRDCTTGATQAPAALTYTVTLVYLK
jgi:hypothetical protein